MNNPKLPFKQKTEFNPLVVDVETQYLSNEVEGGWNSIDKFKVSVAVTWDQKNDIRIWFEEDVRNLLEYARDFSPIVSFNGDGFRYEGQEEAHDHYSKPSGWTPLSGRR